MVTKKNGLEQGHDLLKLKVLVFDCHFSNEKLYY